MIENSVRDKGYKGLAMEGLIASRYAKTTQHDAEFVILDKKLSGYLLPGYHVLELAPGPGYLSIELAKLSGYSIVSLDISKTFVDIARSKASQAGVAVEFRQGNASRMLFEANAFDFIVCRAAFKNFSDPVGALNEIHRVLKPERKALIIDLRRDASIKDIDAFVAIQGLKRADAWVTRWTFRHMLLRRAYTK